MNRVADVARGSASVGRRSRLLKTRYPRRYAVRSMLSRVPCASVRLGLVLPQLDGGYGPLLSFLGLALKPGLGIAFIWALHAPWSLFGLLKALITGRRNSCAAHDYMGQGTYFNM